MPRPPHTGCLIPILRGPAAIVCSLLFLFFFVVCWPACVLSRPFDSAAWQAAGDVCSRNRTRQGMLSDLIHSHLTQGLSFDQVQRLLGNESLELAPVGTPRRFKTWRHDAGAALIPAFETTWCLGPERFAVPFIDCELLTLYFDADKKLIGWAVWTD